MSSCLNSSRAPKLKPCKSKCRKCSSNKATQAVKPVLGDYYREPKRSGWFPLHVFRNLTKSFARDHYVADTGDIVYYQKGF